MSRCCQQSLVSGPGVSFLLICPSFLPVLATWMTEAERVSAREGHRPACREPVPSGVCGWLRLCPVSAPPTPTWGPWPEAFAWGCRDFQDLQSPQQPNISRLDNSKPFYNHWVHSPPGDGEGTYMAEHPPIGCWTFLHSPPPFMEEETVSMRLAEHPWLRGRPGGGPSLPGP